MVRPMKDLFAHVPQRRAIIDRRAVGDRIARAIADADDTGAARAATVAVLREALAAGRAVMAERLSHGRQHGRQLGGGYAFLMEQVVRLLFDAATTKLYPTASRTQGERLTLLSVGGFGRGEMALHSDVDIMFLTPFKQTAWCEQVIETVLYSLWDLRLKVGHSSRSVDEMVAACREDLTIATAVLEGRYLAGDVDLYKQAARAYYDQVVTGREHQFIADKLAERDARHKRMGDSRYVVEPNLKEGIGGLRDLHTLFWIGKFIHRVDDVADLVRVGLFTPSELRLFQRAEGFLWALRCHLHALTNRPEERLTFDVQRELAERLQYRDRVGVAAVERFMKHYFWTAKQVGDLTAVFLAHIQDTSRKKPLIKLPSLKRRPRNLEGFVLQSNRLAIPQADYFRQDPLRLLKLFQIADRHGLEIHPTTMRQANQDAGCITAALRDDPAANAVFLDVLTSPRAPESTLRLMNEAGVFGRFVPDFGRVVAQMQYDMYHHYTVDEHTIRAIGLLSRIEKGELTGDHPLSSELMPKIHSRRVLYVAVLLHDIAKGRRGDHSILGAEVAEKLCPRLGLTPEETETVAWLVRHHLLMSATAFKRDLSDFKTVLDFATEVQSPERLKLLLILTVVDIRAVGPGTWNGWKGQLLRQLYETTEEVLLLGHAARGRRERIEVKQQRMGEQLGWPQEDFERHCNQFFDAYWVAEPQDVLYLNAEQMRIAEMTGQALSVATVIDMDSGATLISVYAADHPGLFFRLAGAISLAGANIVGARIHTTRQGMALDNVVIQCPTGELFDEPERLERLRETIKQSIAGRIKLHDRLAGKLPVRPRASVFKVEPRVLIDNKASNRFTVVEVNAADRPALLFALTYALYQAKVTVHSAHVATYGERAIDVFYITDLTNEKIVNANRLRSLERRLLAALKGETGTEDEAEPLSTYLDSMTEVA